MLVTVPAVPNHSRREALRNRHDVRWKRSCARLQFQRGCTSINSQRDLAHHATGLDHAMRLGRLLQRKGPREADAQLACIEQRRAALLVFGLITLRLEQAVQHRAQHQFETHAEIALSRLLPIHVAAGLQQGNEFARVTQRVHRARASGAAHGVERHVDSRAATPLSGLLGEIGLTIIAHLFRAEFAHDRAFSAPETVLATRAPCSRASWSSTWPTPPAPACINTRSPSLITARSCSDSQAVTSTSGAAAAAA